MKTPPLAFAHLYRALAAGLSDPGPLRRALFAVYCRAVPTSNLTLRNTARDFARQDRAQQVDHLTDLAARLRVLAGGLHEQGHLAARLMSALADWPDQR